MKVGITTVRNAFDAPHYYKEARSLQRAGHEVVMIAPVPAGQDPKDPAVNPLSVRVMAVARAVPERRLSKMALVPALVRAGLRARCDAYQVLEPQSLVAGWILKLFTGAALVYDCREAYPLAIATNTRHVPFVRPVLRFLVWAMETAMARSADHVFVVSRPLLERFAKLGCPSSYLVNFPLRNSGSTPPPYRGGTFEVVFVGFMDPRIAVEEIILAQNILRCEGHDVRLTFVGPFPNDAHRETCLALTKQLDLEEFITFVGAVPFETVATFLQRAQCGNALYRSMPKTRIEENPVKVYEYMAHGLPVVVADLPKLSAPVRDSACGVAVAANDPEAIAEALRALIVDPRRWEQLSRNARDAFLKRYNWESQEEGFLNVFAGLKERRGH